AWHFGPDPAVGVYRVEGDAYGADAYVVNGSTGGFTPSNYNQHLKQPCQFNMGIINGYVMDAQEGCTQATCTPAAVHLEPTGLDLPVDASGYYTASVPACTYEATASAPGYQPDGPYTVPVTTTAPVQQDFCLNRPDIEANPTAFEVNGYYSIPVTYPLEIANLGYPTLTWQILEIPPALAAQREDLVVRPAYFGVDDYIAEEFAASTDGKADIFLAFAGEVDLSPATHIKDWEARGRWVVDTLTALADRSQASVRKWLDAQGIEYTVNLNNTIFVRLTQAQFDQVLRFPEVVGAFGNRSYPLEPLVDPNAPVPNATVDWGLLKVRAPDAWNDYGARGQGIVVANIDTGVQWDHPALDQAYKCASNPTDPSCWLDPSNVCGGTVCDNNGHGTHTMGTMVGDDDDTLQYIVGMAPDAQFIMCKGCETNSCSSTALTACANWLLQPGGNPANRPHVVNNSWGGGGCNTWYQSYVTAWRAAGIFPAFSNGNSGPSCSTSGSPGDYPESFSSGATDSNDAIASFSSRGPSCWGEIKPEVSAPGVNICSSVPTNDWNCGYSGTSMASPHTAGLAAMLWSCNPTLVGNIAATEYIITSTATCIQDLSCGGTSCPDGANNVYGWGRIDAYAAAEAGCLLDIPWVWEDPVTGTTAPGETSIVDVTFHCPVSNVVDLTGTLRIVNNDPCENPLDIPLVLHCLGQCEPLTSADFTWSPTEPPAGTPVLFTASYEPPTASQPVDFTWAFGDGNTGSGITVTHVYLTPGSYEVILTVTNPCSAIVVTHTVVVTLPLEPDIVVTPTSLQAEQCPDTVTTQTLSICNVGDADLSWSLSEVPGVMGFSTPFVPAGRPVQGPVPSLPVSTFATAYRPIRPVPAIPDDVLWDQPLGANTNAYANQDFESIYDAYDIFIADDFTNADPWEITTIFVPGNTWNTGGDLTCATTLNWQIYADAGGVPAGDPWSGGALWNLSLPPTDPQVVLSVGVGGYLSNVTLNLDTPLVLPPGTYWLVFYPQMDFDTCFQYGRHASGTTNGYDAQVINPGGGFGFPTTWTSVRDPSTWGLTEQDFAFRLEGTIYTPPVDVPWLSESPVSGTVVPGECTTVTVLFDSTGMAPGDYYASLLIESNDPDEPQVTVPVTMTVLEPVNNVDFAWTPSTPVVGEMVTFTATASGTGPLTYNWDFGDGGTASGITATHAYTAAGNYVVTLVVGNVCNQVVVTHTVTVVPPCEPPFGADFTFAPPAPVVGEAVTFTGTVVTGTEPLTWAWNFGDGGIGSDNPATHIYGLPGTYTVVMTVSNACGFEVVTHTVVVTGV
ncbi:MAG: S8 family serine peptidase, partial [Chloroflexia bacterium]